MPSTEKTVMAYEELAEWYERQGLDQLRDRFLVLAADTALTIGNADEAERIRARLLERNPHHLLKPFASLAEALKTADVQNYVSGLRRGYPPESVDTLLESLRSGTAEPAPAAPPPRPLRPAPPPDDEEGTLRMPVTAPPPGRPSPKLPPKQVEPPAVYAVKEEGPPHAQDAARPRQVPPPKGPARSAPTPAPPRPAPPAPARPSPPAPKPPVGGPPPRPVAPGPGYSVRPESAAPSRGKPADREAEEDYPGAWLPSALFVLLFLVGIALAVFTFAGPFLPAGWLR